MSTHPVHPLNRICFVWTLVPWISCYFWGTISVTEKAYCSYNGKCWVCIWKILAQARSLRNTTWKQNWPLLTNYFKVIDCIWLANSWPAKAFKCYLYTIIPLLFWLQSHVIVTITLRNHPSFFTASLWDLTAYVVFYIKTSCHGKMKSCN